MHKSLWNLAAAALIAISCSASAAEQTQPIRGTTDSKSGPEWQTSWLDIKPTPLSFNKGETLRVKLIGDAENFIFRLLPEGSESTSTDGIEGSIRTVPKSGTLDIKLEAEHPNVKQISLHAGHEAFEISLGPNNGKVKLISVERLVK